MDHDSVSQTTEPQNLLGRVGFVCVCVCVRLKVFFVFL